MVVVSSPGYPGFAEIGEPDRADAVAVESSEDQHLPCPRDVGIRTARQLRQFT
jgi:hypothetical protein